MIEGNLISGLLDQQKTIGYEGYTYVIVKVSNISPFPNPFTILPKRKGLKSNIQPLLQPFPHFRIKRTFKRKVIRLIRIPPTQETSMYRTDVKLSQSSSGTARSLL